MLDQGHGIFWIIFPIYFASLWLLILVILSYTSGWRALAKLYRLESSFDGAVWRWQSGEMRWTNFNHCLKVGASASGLYLALIPPFSFRTPPLLIPWNEVAVSRGRRFFLRMVRIDLGHELKIALWISPKLADRLQQAAVGHWPVESIG